MSDLFSVWRKASLISKPDPPRFPIRGAHPKDDFASISRSQMHNLGGVSHYCVWHSREHQRQPLDCRKVSRAC